jgi:hypothetical protein
MATQTVRRLGLRPAQTPVTPALKQGTPAVNARSANSLLMPPKEAGNQAAYRTLSQSKEQPKEAMNAPGSAPPATLAGGGKPTVKLPPLSPQLRAQMVEDVNSIAKIMKFWIVDSGDQITVTGIIEKYATLDEKAHGGPNEAKTPNLDHFLILLKSRAFSRSSVKSLFQDQWAILYDALWYRLRGYYLDKFERLVSRSETQKTSGPADKDVENGAALIAKQEAMGMWGMLKGMGTGLVGIAGPAVAQQMAEQFDETAHILFGNEWDSSEPLVWGMNAGQIGTVGGDVIWQLVTFAKGAGPAKAGKIYALVDKLKKAMAVGSGLQGVYLGGTGIARIIEQRQKAGQSITAEALMHDSDFVDQVVVVVTSAIGTVLAAKGAPASKAEAVTRARIQLLMNQAHIASSLARFSEIAASNKSDAEKELEYGRAAATLIGQLASAAIDVHGYAQAKGLPDTPPAAAPKKDAPLPKEEAVATKKAAAPPKEEAVATKKGAPAPKEEAGQGELSRKTMNDAAPPPSKKPPKYHPESEAGQQLQTKLRQEAETGLAPRDARPTPEDIKSGARESRYKPKKDNSTTVGKPAKTLDEARAIYDDVIAETAGKHEVGIYQKPDGSFAVRLGQPGDVNAPSEWRSVQHYHTNEPDIPLWRMPARADVTEPHTRAERTNKPTTEIVEYPLPGGKRGRAAYTVHPDGSLEVKFVDAAGKPAEKKFGSIKEYEQYYEAHKVYVEPGSEAYKRLTAGLDKPAAAPDPGTSTKTMHGQATTPPPKKPAVVYAEGETRVVREPEVVKGRAGTTTPEYQASPEAQTAKRPFTEAELDPLRTEIERRKEVGETFAETEQAALNPEADKFGVQRGPSVDEAQRARQDQDTPSVKAQKKAQVFESHATGLEAKARAEQEGIKFTGWDNPESHRGDFGRGIDAVGERGSKKLIVEYKGETSTLSDDQMSNEWVGRKIAQLDILNDPMAATLLDAARQNNLQGVVYNTKTVDNEPVPRRQDRSDLTKKLPDTKISDAGLIQYNANKVEKAYLAELSRLVTERGLVADPATGAWKSR